MFSAEVRVGRLVEVRLDGRVGPVDVESVRERLIQIFQSHPGKLVGVGDFTRTHVFSQEAATKVVEVFRQDNPRLERSGLLISDSAIFGLQFERLINQAGNPNRRCFRDPFELKAFLGSLLVHEEHARLAQFLSEAQVPRP